MALFYPHFSSWRFTEIKGQLCADTHDARLPNIPYLPSPLKTSIFNVARVQLDGLVRPHTRALQSNGMRYLSSQTDARGSGHSAGANPPRRKPHLPCKPRHPRPAIAGRKPVRGHTSDWLRAE